MPEDFGAWSLGLKLRRLLYSVLPEKSTLLELGSGKGTQELAKYYNIISIEDNEYWLSQCDTCCIHAPIRNGWYDPVVIRDELSGIDYDAILIDGPTGEGARNGFVDFAYLFNLDGWVFIDDVNRAKDWELYMAVRKIVGFDRTAKAFCEDYNKAFGVICPSWEHSELGYIYVKLGLEVYNPYKGAKNDCATCY